MKNNYFAICLAVLFSTGVQAELSARQIMEKVDQNVRQSNDSAFSVSVLSSCRFVQRDRQVVCSDQPRVKKLETVSKQYGRQLKDSRVISVVLEPAADRGVGMLTYSYDDDQKDTESWLYLSALGKVKRLASGDDDKEPVAFFGSEFTTEKAPNRLLSSSKSISKNWFPKLSYTSCAALAVLGVPLRLPTPAATRSTRRHPEYTALTDNSKSQL